METLGSIGEHAAIRRLTENLGTHRDLIVGAGDDCAVVRVPGSDCDEIFTTDPVIENVHFSFSEIPQRIGNKAAGRVLSDLAAMGAEPRWLFVNVVAPASLGMDYLEAIYEGMNTLCQRFGVCVAGGDLAQGPVLELHVFGTGWLPTGTALLRSGSQDGESIFVTGKLGGSRAGKHLDFIPRVQEGTFLRETGLVSAMMDISDGLATDLRHLMDCSGVGAILDADAVPKSGTLEQALYDGEDFELLLTTPSRHKDVLNRRWFEQFQLGLTCIGETTAKTGVLELHQSNGETHPVDRKAFEHFSS